MLKLLVNKKTLIFVSGLVTATVGKKVLQSEKTRQLAVTTVAKGMQFKSDVQETLENFKEEAQDIYVDALKEAVAANEVDVEKEIAASQIGQDDEM